MSDLSMIDYVAIAGAIVILLPVAITPAGWLVAILVVAAWFLLVYGGRYVLGVERERRKGERGAIHEIRHRDEGGR